MGDQFSEARKRAKSTFQTKWQTLARVRTLGWGGPIDRVEDKYPFMREATSKLGDSISPHLPIMIFQSSETPPQQMKWPFHTEKMLSYTGQTTRCSS
ncbi:hypothetical protein ACN28S_58355 [Cystobacter fuscus]